MKRFYTIVVLSVLTIYCADTSAMRYPRKNEKLREKRSEQKKPPQAKITKKYHPKPRVKKGTPPQVQPEKKPQPKAQPKPQPKVQPKKAPATQTVRPVFKPKRPGSKIPASPVVTQFNLIDYPIVHKDDQGIVEVAQVLVANQMAGAKGGGAASCGYHALKNGMLIAQVINGNYTKKDDLTSYEFIQPLFGPHGRWREHIIKNRKRQAKEAELSFEELDYAPNGDWMDGGEIEDLFAQEDARKNQGLLAALPRVGITALSNIKEDITQKRVVDVIRTLKDQPTFTHIFALGTMATDQVKGHWFTCVVHKHNDVYSFVLADSLDNDDRSLTHWVQVVIREFVGDRATNTLLTTYQQEVAKHLPEVTDQLDKLTSQKPTDLSEDERQRLLDLHQAYRFYGGADEKYQQYIEQLFGD